MDFKEDLILDTKGLSCPMPIVKLKQAIDKMQSGQIVKMLATDPGSVSDVQAWSEKTGHRLLGQEKEGDVYIFYLEKS